MTMTAAVGYRWAGCEKLPFFETCDWAMSQISAAMLAGTSSTSETFGKTENNFSPAAARVVFIAAAAAHFIEAAYAAEVIVSTSTAHCSNVNAVLWVLQTFVLGYPSLRLLLRRWRLNLL